MPEKADLLATVIDESERLNRFIANLLDMTKARVRRRVPNTALHDLGEIVGSALRRASKILARSSGSNWSSPPACPCWSWMQCCSSRPCSTCWTMPPSIPPTAPSIRDPELARSGCGLSEVLDEGDGIPPADLEHIFDKFYRAEKGDRVRAGTGLGLAISRGFVEGRCKGQITAANRSDRAWRGIRDQGARCRRRPSKLDTAA
jgi:two-component system sensor histidine kinase KdpD